MKNECQRCGNCCIHATFKFAEFEEQQETKYEDMARWLNYHGVKISRKKAGEKIKYYLSIPTVCEHLKFEKDNTYTCKIYDLRPDLCKRFNCKTGNI